MCRSAGTMIVCAGALQDAQATCCCEASGKSSNQAHVLTYWLLLVLRLLPQDEEFDWEGDRPLETPMEDLVIYEMHVRGETHTPSSTTRNSYSCRSTCSTTNRQPQRHRVMHGGPSISQPAGLQQQQMLRFAAAAANAAMSILVRLPDW